MEAKPSRHPNDADVLDIQDRAATESQPVPTPSGSIYQTLVEYKQLLGFATGLVLPYALHPLLAVEVYHPGIASMWPFSSATFVPATSIKSLAGKVILVTGGNNGIGKETVLQLAKHDPQKIYLASRTESKGRDAISSIKAQTSQNVDIEYLPLDLTSLPSIKQAADQVISHSDRLDILVLNAGIMAVPPGKTASGQDIQMGTNHVGHFLLTKLLLPTLQKTAKEHNSDVRIISVSSEAQNLAPALDTIVSTEKLAATGPWTRYAASKAANIMFAAELARRYPALTSVSLHPGIIKTDLYLPNAKSNAIVRWGARIVGPVLFATVETGALNQLWAAAGAKREELVNGGYYTPVGKHRTNKWSTDADAGRKLWEWTEKELKTAGY
jgi:NAD(P)-dependent dehydrogenase (short-subunit alcohol dehydrogenase family)